MGLFSDLKKIDEKKEDVLPEQVKKDTSPSPLSKKKTETVVKNNCQLNAWISGDQNQLLDQIFYRLRGNGVKIKKGELIGVAIKVLSIILENQSPSTLDDSILEVYIKKHGEKQ